MRQLISHFGLSFYLFELQGSLKYTLTRNGKVPKVYEIVESDLADEGHSESSSAASNEKLETGIDVSAVGVHIHLIKNDGILEIKFEGNNGCTAEWTFKGMGMIDGSRMVGTASTQTDVDPKKCLVCGEDKRIIVEVKHGESQTDKATMHSTSMQATTALAKSSTGAKPATKGVPDNQHTPPAGLKRKAPPTAEGSEPLRKHEKRPPTVENWPRHLYMQCYANASKLLHIDVQKAKVWIEEWIGPKDEAVFEREQMNLDDKTTRIRYLSVDVIGATHSHYLEISREKILGGHLQICLKPSCFGREWKSWGVTTERNADGGRARKCKVPITDPTVIVDALVNCIDRASGRKAVYDPITESRLKEQVKECEESYQAGYKDTESMKKWEEARGAMKELIRRERLRVFEKAEGWEKRMQRIEAHWAT